ncbi:MAG: hypothetical protein AAFZ58_14545 [Pseudomonadota bacterium]
MKPAEPLNWRLIAIRALTVAMPLAAAALFIADVESELDTVARNMVPLVAVLCLAVFALIRNRGRWWRPDPRWPLATLGFAVPAVGLSLYLHILWHYDIDALRTGARDPRLLFAYLPLYTMLAGAIGFALGLIVGRRLIERDQTDVVAKSKRQ